jgi:hypothetical protein
MMSGIGLNESFKPRSVRGDKVIESDFYAVKFQHGGPRKTIGLYTANLWEAAGESQRNVFLSDD